MLGKNRATTAVFQISSQSSKTFLLPTPSSRTNLALSSREVTPALVSTHWLRDVIVLTQSDSEHHLYLNIREVSRRQSLGELSVEELRQHPVCVLDTTWQAEINFDGYEQHYKQAHIPGATFLDLNVLSPPQTDKHENCPIPDRTRFQQYVSTLGVNENTHVITYDSLDTRSAARAWFLFRLFGHDRVSVLDGGLKQWRGDGYEICTGGSDTSCLSCPAQNSAQEQLGKNVELKFRPELLRNFTEMKSIVENLEAQVIDCRPADGAFYANENNTDATSLATSVRAPQTSAPGHMPGAINIPFSSLFTTEGTFKGNEELLDLFLSSGVDFSIPMVASSHRGTASCSIALAAFLLGVHDVPVYNGSWAEWEVLAPQSLIVATRNRN